MSDIWIATENGIYSIDKHTQKPSLKRDKGIKKSSINCIAKMKGDRLLAGGFNCLWQKKLEEVHKGIKWNRMVFENHKEILENMEIIRDIEIDQEENIWLAGKYLVKISKNRAKNISDTLIKSAITSLAISESANNTNTLWIGTETGLYTIENKNLENHIYIQEVRKYKSKGKMAKKAKNIKQLQVVYQLKNTTKDSIVFKLVSDREESKINNLKQVTLLGNDSGNDTDMIVALEIMNKDSENSKKHESFRKGRYKLVAYAYKKRSKNNNESMEKHGKLLGEVKIRL